MRQAKLEILFLGTAAAEGWPGIFCECEPCRKARKLGGKNIRMRSSVLIGDTCKVDLPPDVYAQMIRGKLDFSKLERLFITHEHSDHFCPSELGYRFKPFAHIDSGRILDVYGNSSVARQLGSAKEVMDKSNIRVHEVKPFEPIDAGEIKALPLPADHSPGALIYIFQTRGRTVLYGHDSGWFPEETWKKIEEFKFDAAILDCTNGPVNMEDRWHMGIKGVIKARDRMLKTGTAGPGTKFIATHFSHNGGLLHNELRREFKPAGIIVAFDGLKIYL
ncbi:carbon-phosphorus lyase [Candidatus Desantisbacteria bacterium CG_4_10_14_0_8_um_filter_48_22]|uniref:Carbon-phosphorus lyase n=1 Tax=Candidatus Desantisbacteria bacterium CG_4_10_14_0_8_um_filter_48_22 TaxID=1974543 RepID=A0A2M7SFM2_9BACT|nr:MAG: hypothetical protein AUJ67_08580 [Candidatus Desantisbacteria bacterium CG1_02_49_89]PIV56185.1 MAG: carbon-phosphorus lyase [Candidatus Desantisbacteria bacterium CG02_land_8_20_14_3_00_49_13]PIZ18284.1 MAG: carbon-phosphorus lyase [Candidatus Desantisbacteria bacterium CG_4_10_14_0_8_um_filter_48_22]PJB27320.1 MAG: carbon-phosphorus lyase [Candidatus Desantisbacteria bacterium CG_4_9_14_3_um_filter_50_7]